MGCERVYDAVQAASQVAQPAYDRIEVILAAVAIIVTALGVIFTAAGVVLAFAAIRGWKEMIRGARRAAETAAKEEARKWADIYSDPVRMFEMFGVKPNIEALTPAPKAPTDASNKPAAEQLGERLVEAMAVTDEPQPQADEPPLGDTFPGKEETDVTRTEGTDEPDTHGKP